MGQRRISAAGRRGGERALANSNRHSQASGQEPSLRHRAPLSPSLRARADYEATGVGENSGPDTSPGSKSPIGATAEKGFAPLWQLAPHALRGGQQLGFT